jgi:esterase/lipase superfamily enzyme
VLIFVHGYNTTLADAVLRIAQFVEDTDYTGVPVLFSWASRGKTLNYVHDLNSALHARYGLIETAKLIVQANPESADIVAHSMGNFLTVEAMRQAKLEGWFGAGGRLRNVILASPDIDVDVFKKQMAPFPRRERNFYVLVSEDDKALAFSRRIAGGVSRVGDETAEQLAELGVTVIDLTQVQDSSNLNHSKFADSPEVVRLIGNGILAGNSLRTDRPGGGLVEGLAASLTAIPTAIVGGGGSVIVIPQ